MKMIRTIHSIGQGAFYTEHFENNNRIYNVVYDCGSETGFSGKGKLIDHEITQTFERDEVINALFISHFHRDHINGIENLLKYCTVRHVFLPIIDDISKLLLLTSDDNNDYRDFVMNPLKYIRRFDKETNVIFVKPYNDDSVFFSTSVEQDDINYEIIESGENVAETYIGDIEWKYIPFNLIDNNLIQKIKKAYEDEGMEIPKVNDIKQLNLAKTIFNKIIKSGKERNAHSIVLYSVACDSGKWDTEVVFHNGYICSRHCCLYSSHLWFEYRLKSGCLYLGDYDLKNKGACEKIVEKYKRLGIEDNISIMQVPHHGSKYNFNTDIFHYFKEIKFLFISAGEKNRHRHPSSSVINDIIESDKYLKLVTEEESSMLKFIYRKI